MIAEKVQRDLCVSPRLWIRHNVKEKIIIARHFVSHACLPLMFTFCWLASLRGEKVVFSPRSAFLSIIPPSLAHI